MRIHLGAGSRQIGQRVSSKAQPRHTHMCPQPALAISLGSTMQMVHSLASSAAVSGDDGPASSSDDTADVGGDGDLGGDCHGSGGLSKSTVNVCSKRAVGDLDLGGTSSNGDSESPGLGLGSG